MRRLRQAVQTASHGAELVRSLYRRDIGRALIYLGQLRR